MHPSVHSWDRVHHCKPDQLPTVSAPQLFQRKEAVNQARPAYISVIEKPLTGASVTGVCL